MTAPSTYGAGIDFHNLPEGHPFLKYTREKQERLLSQVWGGFQTANQWQRDGFPLAAGRAAKLTMSLYDGSYWNEKRLP